MAVQIYQNQELNDVMFEVEALDEWKQLASEMGMESQLNFVKHADTPIPYPNINESMKIIFKTLCPMSVDFKSYTKTPIPLEVMKQLSFSLKDKHFKRIEIWYDDKKVDPVAVGVSEKYVPYDDKYRNMEDADGKLMTFDSIEEAQAYSDLIGFARRGISTTDHEEYLIARWADELRPVEELKALAKERLMEKYGAELRIEIENSQQALKKLTDNVTKFLLGEINENELKGKNRW